MRRRKFLAHVNAVAVGAHVMGHEEQAMAAEWVKFFNEDDVYAMIGTVHTVLAQKADD